MQGLPTLTLYSSCRLCLIRLLQVLPSFGQVILQGEDELLQARIFRLAQVPLLLSLCLRCLQLLELCHGSESFRLNPFDFILQRALLLHGLLIGRL